MPDKDIVYSNEKTLEKQQLWNILCVDDESSVLMALRRLLKRLSFQVTCVDDVREALARIKQTPFDIVLSDMRMPNMTGAEFLAQVAELQPDCYRILLTGYSDNDSTIAAINKGGIHHYIQKPWNNADLILTLKHATEKITLQREKQQLLSTIQRQNSRLNKLNKSLEANVLLRTRQIRKAMTGLEKVNQQITQNHQATLKVFYNLISLNPNIGGRPAVQVAELCELIARKMHLSDEEVRAVHLAGLISELGLVAGPEELQKTPFSELTSQQRKKFLNHPDKAYTALTPAQNLIDVALIIRHQYEHINGSGTPEGLSGAAIPIGARILAVARDYIYYQSGKILKVRTNSNKAMSLLMNNADHIYEHQILQLLPELIPQLDDFALSDNEQLLTIDKLKSGMTLSRNLHNKNAIMLLPEGHQLTSLTLARLKSFQHQDKEFTSVYVFEQCRGPDDKKDINT